MEGKRKAIHTITLLQEQRQVSFFYRNDFTVATSSEIKSLLYLSETNSTSNTLHMIWRKSMLENMHALRLSGEESTFFSYGVHGASSEIICVWLSLKEGHARQWLM